MPAATRHIHHPAAISCRATLLLLSTLLTGCAAPLSYSDVQATAQVTGCWPDPFPTPRLVTITSEAGVQPTGTTLPGTPTATALPTITPYPRCAPAPGATLIPWPTPVPNPPPYPTMEPRRWMSGSDQIMTMRLPGTVYTLDLAAHPTEGWPVVAATQRNWGTPIQAFVRVYDPHAQRWGMARQVDTGRASTGNDSFGTVAVAVSGDGTVYAAWGASDADHAIPGDTPDVWVSSTTDYGAHWAAPRRIARDCWNVQDMAADAAGNVVVLANCFTHAGGRYTSRATFAIKPAGSDWQPAQRLQPTGSSGSVVLVGEGSQTRVVALTTGFRSYERRHLNLLSRPIGGGSWSMRRLDFDPTPDNDADLSDSSAAWHLRSLVFPFTQPDGTPATGIAFTWATYTRAALFSLVSRDGGSSWQQIEPITALNGSPDRVGALDFIAPAYDPVAGRLVAFWTCCGRAEWEPEVNTHYAGWNSPGSGQWRRWPHALTLGALEAHDTATAQAFGSRMAWLAWIDQGQQVMVRSVDLNTIIPVEDYPTATSLPSATIGGQP